MKKTTTQTQTNVSVGVAVALFLVAGGLAFAALPGAIQNSSDTSSYIPKVAKETCDPIEIFFETSCAENAYSSAAVLCGNGVKHSVEGKKECLEKDEIKALAYEICSHSCAESTEKKITSITESSQQRTLLSECQSAPLIPGDYILSSDIVIPISENGEFSSACFSTQPGESTGIDCQNNSLQGMSGSEVGIVLSGERDIIENCRFESVANPIQITSFASGATVQNNTIFQGGKTSAIAVGSGDEHYISANTIEHVLGHGISLQSGNNIQVRDNVIVDAHKNGIHHEINTEVGEDLSVENVSIQDNIIRGSHHNGMYFSQVSGGTVSDNEIHSSQQRGIFIVNSSDLSVIRNTVERNGLHGVDIQYKNSSSSVESETNHSVMANIFIANGGSGAEIWTDANIIQDNEFIQNNQKGLRVFGNQNTIERNMIYENIEGGVEILNTNGNQFIHNTIHDHDNGVGILFYAQSEGKGIQNIVKENRIFRNKIGVTLIGVAQTLVEGNLVYNNQFGIKILRDVQETQFVENLIERNMVGVHFGLIDQETEVGYEFFGQEVPPFAPQNTTIRAGEICRNIQFDVSCFVQNGVSIEGAKGERIGECAVDPQWELDFISC